MPFDVNDFSAEGFNVIHIHILVRVVHFLECRGYDFILINFLGGVHFIFDQNFNSHHAGHCCYRWWLCRHPNRDVGPSYR